MRAAGDATLLLAVSSTSGCEKLASARSARQIANFCDLGGISGNVWKTPEILSAACRGTV
jgi:hypothetical protein